MVRRWLALVLVSALAAAGLLFAPDFSLQVGSPVQLHEQTVRARDLTLICPGPALSLISSGQPMILLFVAAMVAGILLVDRVLVKVRDHGPGVAPEALPNLMKPFFRGDAARTAATGAGRVTAAADESPRPVTKAKTPARSIPATLKILANNSVARAGSAGLCFRQKCPAPPARAIRQRDVIPDHRTAATDPRCGPPVKSGTGHRLTPFPPRPKSRQG